MVLEEIIYFLKKKGLKDTFQVLASFDDFRAEKHAFYDELNKFSYYNSFFRIKDDMIEKRLLVIDKRDNKKYMRLTKKGIEFYNRLVEINGLLEDTPGRSRKI